MSQAQDLIDEFERTRRGCILAWLEAHIGQTALVKDRHTSQYLTISGPGDDKYYRCHGRDGSGKFRLEDVAWAESDTIWLGGEGDS